MSSKRTTRSKLVQSDDAKEEIQKSRLNDLERDNYHQEEEEVDSDFEIEGVKSPAAKKRKTRTVGPKSKKKGFTKRKFDKIIDDEKEPIAKEYLAGVSAPSTKPRRFFCSICGDFSPYTCTTCGQRYCTIQCMEQHKETRCMRYTAL